MKDPQPTLYRRVRSRLRSRKSLRSAYYFFLSLGDVLRDPWKGTRSELNDVFSRSQDPWNYAGPLEQRRHELEMEMLGEVVGPGKFSSVIEIGCAEGTFTSRLAGKCAALLAVDISDVAIRRAQERCSGMREVRFQQLDVRRWSTQEREVYDLIVAIHVLEYVRSPFVLRRIRKTILEKLRPGGYLLLGSVYQESASETSWWGELFLLGGNWLNELFARHPLLEVLNTRETDLGGGCRSRDLLLRKRPSPMQTQGRE